MDGALFDRIARALSGRTKRREAVRVFMAGGLTAVAGGLGIDEITAKKKKRKKRCRKLGQTCGGKKKCCNKSGLVQCQEFPQNLCQGVSLTGNRCCGLEGSICDPTFGTPIDVSPISGGNCSCCEQLFCGKQPNGEFRCQTEDT